MTKCSNLDGTITKPSAWYDAPEPSKADLYAEEIKEKVRERLDDDVYADYKEVINKMIEDEIEDGLATPSEDVVDSIYKKVRKYYEEDMYYAT